MSVKLYELSEQYAKFVEFGDDQDVDVSEYLSEIREDLETKAEAICKIIKMLEAETSAFAEESKRLQLLAASRTKRVEHLKRYLKDNLETAGLDKLKAGLFSLAIQASPPNCEVLDENAVPDCFKEKRFVVLKREIIDIWKSNGEEIPGVVVTRNSFLRIR